MSQIDPADIPVVILAGGKGTRIREASESLPKPMIDVGGKPIMWHIMKTFAHYGHRRFVLLLGFKSWTVKEYFLRYREITSDFTVDLRTSGLKYHGDYGTEEFEVTMAYTGLDTLTGGRLARARPYLEGAPAFMLTYGDGLADIDVAALRDHHFDHGKIGTVTAVNPTSRFGELATDGAMVTDFAEKPDLNTGVVNGGYFMFNADFLDYVTDPDGEMLESDALQRLTNDGQLGFRLHKGFWRGMDTYREYVELNALWDSGEAPWRVWQ
ncbi:MAG: glucose-1-phosphate cytidylyltransferase [Acidimicrobiales bacterium]